jgi:hypothetical protein
MGCGRRAGWVRAYGGGLGFDFGLPSRQDLGMGLQPVGWVGLRLGVVCAIGGSLALGAVEASCRGRVSGAEMKQSIEGCTGMGERVDDRLLWCWLQEGAWLRLACSRPT